MAGNLNPRSARRPSHPGRLISREMVERGWTTGQISEAAGIPWDVLGAVNRGERAVDAEIAAGLSRAFGTGPEIWMNMQRSHEEWEPIDAKEANRGRNRS